EEPEIRPATMGDVGHDGDTVQDELNVDGVIFAPIIPGRIGHECRAPTFSQSSPLFAIPRSTRNHGRCPRIHVPDPITAQRSRSPVRPHHYIPVCERALSPTAPLWGTLL